jgi:hypothetical protein
MQCATAQTVNNELISSILESNKEQFGPILNNLADNRLQVMYTQIKRGKKGKVSFTHHYFNTDKDKYFYPASTVKLPIAILALQRLNELKIKGLNKYTTFLTGQDGNGQTSVNNDPTAPDGRPTIARYIKKILLVSDNDAFNRLYEFLGQEYIHASLQKMGYTQVQIIHRLQLSLSEAQNRHTNPISFMDSNCNIIYQQAAKHSQLVYTPRNIKLGKGYYKQEELINEPFDFSTKNQLPLQDLHQIVISILFPTSVDKRQRFNLTEEDYRFLRKYMSMTPLASTAPVYKEPAYWDNYVKFLYYGADKEKPDGHIRIFNKVGDAYGFLIDGAYIVDYKNKVEFFLSAAILCNSDGIFNDDNYDYDAIGFPFFKNLGRAIYQYELTHVSENKKSIPSFVDNDKN